MTMIHTKRWLRRRSPQIIAYTIFICLLLPQLPTILALNITPSHDTPVTIQSPSTPFQIATYILTQHEPLLKIAHVTPNSLSAPHRYEITGTKTITTQHGPITINLSTIINPSTNSYSIQSKTIHTPQHYYQENTNDLIIYHQDQFITLSNIPKKTTKYKALHNYIEPLINPAYLTNPELAEPQEFLIISNTALRGHQPYLTVDDYSFYVTKNDDLRPLFRNKNIQRIANNNPGNLKKLVNYAKQLFKEEAEKLAQELNLKKSHNDVIALPQLNNYLNEQPWEPQPGQTSPYQRYITPQDPTITQLTDTITTISDAYDTAKSWTWVSDNYLLNQPEKWLLPTTFLSDSPTYTNNPTKGKPASDCSEQANTLCSLLRAIGIPAEDVRVAIGKVTFDGTTGGHAWVEIKQDNQWLVLDPTSGPFYDEDQQRLIGRNGVDYMYWKYHPYPIEEIWAYYNDQYYTDENEEVAQGWSTPYDVFLNEEMLAGFFSYQSQNLYVTFIIITLATTGFLILFLGNRIYKTKKH